MFDRVRFGVMAFCMSLALIAVPASAVPITFDGGDLDASAKTYTESGFVVTPASLNNSANCPGAGPCLLANKGAFSTISMTSATGGAFDVASFEGHFTSEGVLEVIGIGSALQKAVFKGVDLGTDSFLAALNFTNIEELLFNFSGKGTARIDNVDIGATPVPLPGSLTLLLGALGGLAYISRRRRSTYGS